MSDRRKPSTRGQTRSGRSKRPGRDVWRIDLHTERSGLHPDRVAQFVYRYERLRVERVGRRCSVREFRLQLDYGADRTRLTNPKRVVRQRGRSLPVEEADALWTRVDALCDRDLREVYPCRDDTDPDDLDDAVGPDGVPLAVSLGEEGPACLTVRVGRQQELVRRLLVDRYRPPAAEAARRGRARRAPATALLALIDPGLREAHPFNYRRSKPLQDLAAELDELKGLAFLNLRQFERHCLEALGCLGDPQAIPLLTGALFGSDPEVRLQALDALAAIGDGSAAQDVELLRYDDHPSIRERARSVLERLRPGEVPF